ncbi:MAG: nucleotidyltransferase domain-containing protein [Chloroflexota bacterium]
MFNVDINRLAKTLSKSESVVAAWLFGSGQNGWVRKGGDIDIAILFFYPPSPDQIINLHAKLQEILEFENIDLVVLNNTSVALCYESILGNEIYCADTMKKAEFVSLVAREYEFERAFLEYGLKIYAEAVDSKTDSKK